MKIEQIATGINELYDNTNDSHKENIKTLIDNISNKNASWLLEDIYTNKHTENDDKCPYGMSISLATIIYGMVSDECSEKIMQCDSLYSFILRRNTLIKRYNLKGSDYTPYECKPKDLFEICKIYSKRYNLNKDLKDIDFYKNDIAIMYDIDKSELCRNGKNKNLFDHFEKCINSYSKIKNKKDIFYVTQQ